MNKSATSKEILLKRAGEIAYEEGIGKLSIRRLASETGVAIGTVYNYYPSKADLIGEVMEEFWRNVFHRSSFDVNSSDFIASLHEVFSRLSASLKQFKTEFLEDIDRLKPEEVIKGKETEQFYINHMKQGLIQILKRDKRVRENIWTDTFSMEEFMDFVFSNMILALKEQRENCSFLQEVVSRLLYEK